MKVNVMMEKRISKLLSLVLRHKPEVIGIEVDKNGWTDAIELISKVNEHTNEVSLTYPSLCQMVLDNNKQRFTLNADGSKIRANQGHSIDVDVELNETTPPDVLFHGTATRFKDSILGMGIDKQSRLHVHLSADTETATKVGQRHGKLFIFEVDAKSMSSDGHKFYLSKNSVWLTDNVPVKYLKEHKNEIKDNGN
jgi:putative RNA 2'-phosphotransferase